MVGSGKSNTSYTFNDKYEVELSIRKPKKFSKNNKFSIGVLADPRHEGVDLSDSQIKKAISDSNEIENYGFNFRKQRNKENGLLLLYPIITFDENTNYDQIKAIQNNHIYNKIPTIGFAISFPSDSRVSKDESNIRYVVNNIYQKDIIY